MCVCVVRSVFGVCICVMFVWGLCVDLCEFVLSVCVCDGCVLCGVWRVMFVVCGVCMCVWGGSGDGGGGSGGGGVFVPRFMFKVLSSMKWYL